MSEIHEHKPGCGHLDCACDKRDWCGCIEQVASIGAICIRCQMHQYRRTPTRIRRRGPRP